MSYDLGEALARISDAFRILIDALSKSFYPLYLAKLKADQNAMIAASPCSGRVKHLARYAKKRRVRKKNLNRIRKENPPSK